MPHHFPQEIPFVAILNGSMKQANTWWDFYVENLQYFILSIFNVSAFIPAKKKYKLINNFISDTVTKALMVFHVPVGE